MIPKGLPGEGDLLVYDNGGKAGYGAPNPNSLDGTNNVTRDYTRVLQFNPITLEIVWQYTPEEAGHLTFFDGSGLYSAYISSAQRLPNGNTLITEGCNGRIFEITPEYETVWEYVNPYYVDMFGKYRLNMIYRAYRVPYEWIPQVEHSEEIGIEPVNISTFRLPNAALGLGDGKITLVDGIAKERLELVGISGGQDASTPVKALEEGVDFCAVKIDASSGISFA
jgi:hypothetical protein